MLKGALAFAVAMVAAAIPSFAQDSDFGVAMPVTISGGVLRSGRLQFEDPANSPFAAGFRAMLYPTLKLGPHWFAYSAVQVRMAPYFYYDAYEPDRELHTNTIQAYLGYTSVVFSVRVV